MVLSTDTTKVWAKVVAKCWQDETFKRQVITNPNRALEEQGLKIPTGVRYKVIEEKGQERHTYIALPKKPRSADLNRHLKELNVDSGSSFGKIWSKVIAKSWQEEGFRARVIAEPAKVLAEAGYTFDPATKFKVIEEESIEEHAIHLSLPAKPQKSDLREEELRHLSGALCASCGGCAC